MAFTSVNLTTADLHSRRLQASATGTVSSPLLRSALTKERSSFAAALDPPMALSQKERICDQRYSRYPIIRLALHRKNIWSGRLRHPI